MPRARTKQQKKTMALFASSYGFRQPYQVLLDADFVQMAASQGMDMQERLEASLSGRVKLLISQCSVEHLYARGDAGQAAVLLARSVERRKCNHWQAKEAEDDCLAGLVGDKNALRYVVVTQSAELRDRLRQVPGTPLLYINPRSVLLLEAPSEASVSARKDLESSKRAAPADDVAAVLGATGAAALKGKGKVTGLPSASALGAGKPARQTAERKMLGKRKHGASRPNPLSVLPKKRKKRPMPGTTRETLPLRHKRIKPKPAGDAPAAAKSPSKAAAPRYFDAAAAADGAPAAKKRKRSKHSKGDGGAAGDDG